MCGVYIKAGIDSKKKEKETDPRKMPLNQCMTLGQLMMHIEECKQLNREDQERNFIKEEEMEI
jgi:hypothetical protein